MASTISAARGALYDLLVTAAAGAGPLSGVQISWGDPLAYEEQEVVALGGVSEPTRTLATFDDEYDQAFGIVLRLKVHGPEDDAETVDTRGWTLAAGIDDVVDANASLTGTVASAVSDGGTAEFGAQRAVDAPGWVIFINQTVNCVVL